MRRVLVLTFALALTILPASQAVTVAPAEVQGVITAELQAEIDHGLAATGRDPHQALSVRLTSTPPTVSVAEETPDEFLRAFVVVAGGVGIIEPVIQTQSGGDQFPGPPDLRFPLHTPPGEPLLEALVWDADFVDPTTRSTLELQFTPLDLDVDDDGYFVGHDCNDNDATIHPDAFDPAGDGIDQDCDGSDSVVPALTVKPEKHFKPLSDAERRAVWDFLRIEDVGAERATIIANQAIGIDAKGKEELKVKVTETEAGDVLPELLIVVGGGTIVEHQIQTRKGDGSFVGPGRIRELSFGGVVIFEGVPSTDKPMTLEIELRVVKPQPALDVKPRDAVRGLLPAEREAIFSALLSIHPAVAAAAIADQAFVIDAEEAEQGVSVTVNEEFAGEILPCLLIVVNGGGIVEALVQTRKGDGGFNGPPARILRVPPGTPGFPDGALAPEFAGTPSIEKPLKLKLDVKADPLP